MIDRSQQLRLVEALLFAAAEPLDEAAIAARLPDGADVPALLAELEAAYRLRGVNLVRVAEKWVLRTAPDLAPHLMLERTVSRKLSRAAVETLAIVAYHQPVTRGEIEEIRGVALSRGTLDTLMEMGWVKPKGRRETPGRPVTWVTTDAFLSHFGLESLTDLPGIEELKAAGLLEFGPVASLGETLETAEEAEASADSEDQPLEL
jgi:segregation and condensation protein B